MTPELEAVEVAPVVAHALAESVPAPKMVRARVLARNATSK